MDESDSCEEDNTFYFESDHLALRGNADYTNVLRTIAVLEVQRTRVLKQVTLIASEENKQYLILTQFIY